MRQIRGAPVGKKLVWGNLRHVMPCICKPRVSRQVFRSEYRLREKIKPGVSSSSLLLAASFPALAQATLGVDWDWKRSRECKPVSPAIKVTGIPADERSLIVSIIDHDMRSYDHGGGRVAVSGDSSFTLHEAALKSYKGPCPPNFRSFGHDYEFIVRAIAADRKTELARGRKVKAFAASTVKE